MRIPHIAAFGAISLVLAAGISVPLGAHHAFTSEFDASKPVKLRGTVINWAIEGGTPNTLFRLGITKDSLAIGSELLVDGYRAKDGSNRANGRDITFADGRKVFIGGSSPGAPPPNP